MAHIPNNRLLKHLCEAMTPARDDGPADPLLLQEFVARRDERAFRELVRRHGPLVLGVCQRVLHDLHAAEDAFQATFLVLARKADSIRQRQSLRSWLYGVAHRVALKARSQAARWDRRERPVAEPAATEPATDSSGRELLGLLDDELQQLPEKYRAPLLLCYLHGRTQDEAARELHWSLGTFRRRLDQARECLRHRLTRRGFALSAALFPALLAQHAAAAVPARLLADTCRAAVLVDTNPGSAAATIAPSILALTEDIMRSLWLTRVLKTSMLLVLLLGLAGIGGLLLPPLLADPAEPAKQKQAANEAVAPATPFPRRMLAIGVNNYWFANPISYGTGDKALDRALARFAALLRIPAEHVSLLSDGVLRREGQTGPPIKSASELARLSDAEVEKLLTEQALQPYPTTRTAIEHNVGRFLQGRGVQERIILLFVGHAVEIEEKAYVVPSDGDPSDPKNLIPLTWLYEQLEKCKARQKVLILDVCRLDPVRGQERGRVERMGPKFDALLSKPPVGVEVLTACTAGQHSYELDSPEVAEVQGGILLNLAAQVKLPDVEQRPQDALPIDSLAAALIPRTKYLSRLYLKQEQSPRPSGAEADHKVEYDPKALMQRFEIELPPAEKDIATRPDWDRLFRDIADIPPIRRTSLGGLLSVENLPPYPASKLLEYRTDETDSDLRMKVREGVKFLRENDPTLQMVFLRNFNVNNVQQVARFKDQVVQKQTEVALLQVKYETMLDEVDALEPDRAKESKRWQAIYDFVRARLAAKTVFLWEYNAKLGALRKEMPELDPQIHKGWQLAASADIEDRDAQKFARRARESLERLETEHAGTPWEVLARRERSTNLGLTWRPR